MCVPPKWIERPMCMHRDSNILATRNRESSVRTDFYEWESHMRMTDSTENTTPLKSTKSRSSDFTAQIQNKTKISSWMSWRLWIEKAMCVPPKGAHMYTEYRFSSGTHVYMHYLPSHGFEIHRTWIKGTKLLFQIINAIIITIHVHTLVRERVYVDEGWCAFHPTCLLQVCMHNTHTFINTFVYTFAFLCLCRHGSGCVSPDMLCT